MSEQNREKWENEYRESLIKGIVKIISDDDKIHTVNLENAYAELMVLRNEEGYPITEKNPPVEM